VRAVKLIAVAAVSAGLALGASSAGASASFQNCKALNSVYRHGVGRVGAHDHTRSGTNPVTNFKRSNRLYRLNRGLDRDRDGIACEKH
jgi:Excalibur calcium-binding domain